MIKQSVLSKIKFTLAACLVFALSFILRVNFIIPTMLLVLVVYLQFFSGFLKAQHHLLELSLLFVLVFVGTYMMVLKGIPVTYLPFCAVPMFAAILFNDPRVSLLLAAASSLAVGHLAGNNFYLGILFFTSGLIANILVFDVRKRTDIMRAGFIVGIAQAAMLFFINQFLPQEPYRYLVMFLNGIGCAVIVIGFLPVFEYLFGTVTNISLLELADFNNPILQRMIMEAPGTYHHSLVVGNLSEAACRAVGAHALLARIGSYYHDIGKLEKPEYFSENQNLNENKHDVLSPTMSKLVIMNHVKDGVELAKRYKLNPRIIDFIQQHHGDSIVYYFYRRALETIEEQQVKEEGFRYEGPKPDSKETAIVLLADSVEATCRALKEPVPAKIENVVHKIINNKFIDGQLDQCELTLRDLEKIAAVFIRILSGIYHSRVTYP
ncbi:MAG: HDIG domain-containing protein, partial [Candidatus Omnitrophica bacterium]|nr:HDIG domain-containing protein [Candidatus Omnitrophota bacterium]